MHKKVCLKCELGEDLSCYRFRNDRQKFKTDCKKGKYESENNVKGITVKKDVLLIQIEEYQILVSKYRMIVEMRKDILFSTICSKK